ncbi:MAG: hypothetical protein KAQ94_06090 [Arcobacteraceae bacterium]|nr:hypothetical protein [Arcobacteraceae bacterium]
MTQKYLPIQAVATINEVEPIKIMSIYYKNKDDERFKIIDGKVFVVENYKYPFADELNELREKALVISHNENKLCHELSLLGNTNKDTLRKYFYRFTFKQVKQAKELIALLTLYINQNSLFPTEELNYEY